MRTAIFCVNNVSFSKSSSLLNDRMKQVACDGRQKEMHNGAKANKNQLKLCCSAVVVVAVSQVYLKPELNPIYFGCHCT